MIDTSYRRKFLRINQIWFSQDQTISDLLRQKRKADIMFVHAVPKSETAGHFRGWQEFHTCVNDLTLTEEELLAGINKNVRYQIRRSEKDGISVRFYEKADIENDRGLLDKFRDIYVRMYKSKGVDTDMNIAAVEKYLEQDKIVFTAVWHDDEMLLFHSYVCDNKEARLLHSASFFREEGISEPNMIGRANKKLHWEEMVYFKKKGYEKYDWGGISDFDNPNGIDEFKLKFGGEKVTYYNVFAGNTILGKAAVAAMKLLKRLN